MHRNNPKFENMSDDQLIAYILELESSDALLIDHVIDEAKEELDLRVNRS